MDPRPNYGALRGITREALEPLWLNSRLTLAQMAERLNVTGSGLQQKAKRLGLPPRGKRVRARGSDEEFRRLWMAGVSRNEIAAMLGYKNGNSLSPRCRKLGLPNRHRVKGAGIRNGKGLVGWGGTITAAQYREHVYAERMRGAA